MHSWRGLLDLKNDRCGHLIFYSSRAQLLSIPAINFFLEMSGGDRLQFTQFDKFQLLISGAHLPTTSTQALFWKFILFQWAWEREPFNNLENIFVLLCYNLCFNSFNCTFFLPLRDRWRNLSVYDSEPQIFIGQILIYRNSMDCLAKSFL